MLRIKEVIFDNGDTVIRLHDCSRSSNTGYVGIHRRKDGQYTICKGADILGWRATLDEATQLLDEAEQHKANGTYDAWFAAIKAARRRTGRK